MPKRRRRVSEKRKPKKPSSSPEDDDGEWWTIRDITAERVVKGRQEYKVDWDDNRITGEAYEPTWVPVADVLPEAIREWEEKKEKTIDETYSTQAAPESQVTDESQPPRPANARRLNDQQSARRKRTQPEDTEDEDDVARKRARRETVSSSVEPAPPTPVGGTFQTAGQQLSSQQAPQNLTIEIGKDPDFDPSEYLSFPGSQITAGQHSSQSLSELESEDQRIVIAGCESQRTIPDSQDPSSLELSESQRLATQQSSVSDHPVIADSQDPYRIDSSPVKSSSSKSKSGSSRDQVIPASTGVEEDIPSHQVDQHPSIGSQDLSAESHKQQSDQATSLDLWERPQTCRTESSGEPGFYTQPTFAPYRDVSQSLSTSEHRDPESAIKASTQDEHFHRPAIAEEPSPRESQAAQIVRQPYDAGQEHAQETNDTITQLSSLAQLASPSTTSAHSRSASETLGRSMEAPSQEQGPPQADQTVAQEASPVREPASALSKLQSLWPDDASAPAAGHSSAAAELAAFDATAPQQESHEAAFFTQPQHLAPPISFDGSIGDGASGSSAPVAEQSQPSAVDSLRNAMNEQFSANAADETLMPPPQDFPQGTVSPAEVSQPIDIESKNLALLPSLSEDVPAGTYDGSGNSITMGQMPQTREQDEFSEAPEPESMDHLITLPFQASIRPLYDETLLKYKNNVIRFGKVFHDEVYVPPEEELVQSIDELFNRLQNLCDYPEDFVGTPIENLPAEEKIKFSLDANSKFNFVFELLQGITRSNRVLIVARTVNMLRPLVQLVETLDLECTCAAIGHNPKNSSSAVQVTLSLPDQDDASLYDVVVGYDSAFNESQMSRALTSEQPASDTQPLVLRLAVAFSIEHLKLEMPEAQTEIERKNILLYSITEARETLQDPPPLPEPYKIARLFADFLNGELEVVHWLPESLPTELFDVYDSSQPVAEISDPSAAEADNGLKRKLDEDDDDEEDAETKRMRRFSRASVYGTKAPPLQEDVRALLDKVNFKEAPTDVAQISLPLAVLQDIAAKLSEAERAAEVNSEREEEYKKAIDTFAARNKEYEDSYESMYEKHRAAVQDRTQFEAEARKATAALQTKDHEIEKREAKIADLESRLARLTADAAEGTLGATEKLLQEKTAAVERLEKSVKNAREGESYAQARYQDATSSTTSMNNEINELRSQNEELQRKASDSLTNIHKMQQQNMAKDLLEQIKELKNQLKDAQRELDRTREENKQLQKGRRETRQASAPRSPRMGMMSPRAPGRPPVSGSVSRGGSPGPLMGAFDTGSGPSVVPGAPAMQFTNTQGGNGRITELK